MALVDRDTGQVKSVAWLKLPSTYSRHEGLSAMARAKNRVVIRVMHHGFIEVYASDPSAGARTKCDKGKGRGPSICNSIGASSSYCTNNVSGQQTLERSTATRNSDGPRLLGIG